MRPARLLIADRHELVRLGVRAIVETEADLQLVAELDDAGDAIAEVKRRSVDVALLEIGVRSLDGIKACRKICAGAPDTKALMLTSYSDDETVFSAIDAGASGYLLKDTRRREFLRAVRAVAKGESYLDPSVTHGVFDRFKALTAIGEEHTACGRRLSGNQKYSLLSKREREVFPLIIEGWTNRDIAAQLFVSEHTVRNHVSHILHKLGLNRRSQLVTAIERSPMEAE